jgi:hypothetical protein
VDSARLAAALATNIDPKLSNEIVSHFLKLRRDCATATLERASAGKFVEVFVQCCQHLATGTHDAAPNVDGYLNTKIENEAGLPDGIRFCAGRFARAIYTLRNKRNIAHNNPIDPNTVDLQLAHSGAAWIMAEFLRNASGVTMQEAGALIALVQAPVGTLVEEIDGIRLVHAQTSVKGEILILLHSHYPDPVAMEAILKTMKARSAGSVRNRLAEMRTEKLVHGDNRTGYRLTQAGYKAAVDEVSAHTD